MKTRTWIFLLAVMLILCGGLSIWLLKPAEDAARAELWLDGELYKTVDLSEDQQFEVCSDLGTNTVTVKDGAIAVTAADCPDHYCMDRGYCAGGAQIVCLPNRLVIRFVGEQTVDGAVG